MSLFDFFGRDNKFSGRGSGRRSGRNSGRDRGFHALVREIFGVRARNIELYKLALMHRSASIHLSDGTNLNNERLEFLGDSILDAIVADYLFIEFPRADEGELTRLRSKIVSRQSLNELAREIGLEDHIIRHTGGGAIKKHIGGDAFEAMVGAIYLDRGYNKANRVIINRLFRRYLDPEELAASETDYKSRLIEWCQKNRQSVQFLTGRDESYTSQSPVFRSAVVVDGIEVGHSLGGTKKESEQHAAHTVWTVFSDEAGDLFLENIDEVAERNLPEHNSPEHNSPGYDSPEELLPS